MKKVIELPSKCKPYPGVDPSRIEIRTMKGCDKKLLADMVTASLEEKFAALLASKDAKDVPVLSGIDPRQLTMGDRAFLLVWLQANSQSVKFPLEFRCGSCSMQLDLTADLSKLPVTVLPDDFVEPLEVTFQSSRKVKVKLLRVGDEIDALRLEKAGQVDYLRRFAMTLVEPVSLDERIKLLEEADAKDLLLLQALYEQYFHGPLLQQPYECPRCAYQGLVKIPLNLELFFPAASVVD